MKTTRIGKSIKTIKSNGKEEFLTVESYQGDIGLFKNGKLVAKRERFENQFTYNNETYLILY